MKIKYFIYLFLAFFMALLLFGCDISSIGSDNYGTAKIEGYVMDVSNNNGIEKATVMTAQANDTSYSDKIGNFIFLDYTLAQNPQVIDIIVQKAGYKTSQLKVTLHDGETAHVTIPMIPN
jgi:hypothetical protein